MLGSGPMANDAFQGTFVKIYEKRESFRGDNFAAWLFTIARHTCYNMLRAKKEYASFDDTYPYSRLHKTTDFGLKQALEEAVNSLPNSLKEAFILREYEELSYQEIADILGIDLSLAKIRVFRARKRLRIKLKPLMKELDEHR